MEKKFYTDEFEQLLKEKSDQFRMYPSKRVWHSIYNDLHPGRKWPSVAMSMLLVIILLLTGYLNTSDNAVDRKFDAGTGDQAAVAANDHKKISHKITPAADADQQFNVNSDNYLAGRGSSADVFTDNPFLKNTGISANAGIYSISSPEKNTIINELTAASVNTGSTNGNHIKGIVEKFDTYLKTSQIFTDVAAVNKKNKTKITNPVVVKSGKNTGGQEPNDENSTVVTKPGKESNGNGLSIINPTSVNPPESDKAKITGENNNDQTADKNNISESNKNNVATNNKTLSAEEKAWIENFALHNKSVRSKWKDRLAMDFYVTPAVNYRELGSAAKGSATPFANNNINSSVSHKPGLGIEAGAGLTYAFAKNIRLKAGLQFNFTNYGINADATTHPVLTMLLLNDINTGYSYTATRTSTLSNAHDSRALRPVTIHNTTFQLSIPIGVAFKLATANKLEWYAGATIQPTYVFGGKAHIISADLKDYISEPSMIRNWNLNTGIETYISYKLGSFNLLAGPQFRYQWYSTYSKNSALIEKPYAMGLKIGIVKGL